MKNLQELTKSIKEHNETMRKVGGFSSLSSLVESMQKMNQINLDLTGLSGIFEVAREIAYQMEGYDTTSKKLAAQMAAIQTSQNNFALSGLTSLLSQIARQNQLVSNKLADLGTSQLLVSHNLTKIAKSFNQSHLSQFNSLNIAFQGITRKFLREISVSKAWSDFDIAEEANETISNLAEDAISNTTAITQTDLENFRTSIIIELSKLLTKSNSERVRQFIIELITVISFILTLYSVHQVSSDKSNNKVIIETKKELDRLNTEFSQRITEELQKLNKKRTALVNVSLRYSVKKNSKIIGLVKKDQIVTVIEIRHKFLLISYLDKETGEPKSGFVIKKYFIEAK